MLCSIPQRLSASFVLIVCILLTLASVHKVHAAALKERVPGDYAPKQGSCPSKLTRKASPGQLNTDEQQYIKERKGKADEALHKWLQSAGFTTDESQLPTLALTTSGGGYRALLTGAGVHQALDSREDVNSSLAGLYQSLTYESGLSGGGWLVGSLMGNNWPRISDLRDDLWYRTFTEGLLLPGNILTLANDLDIAAAVLSKGAAGYTPTLVDFYGRLLGYSLLKAPEGGIAQHLSDIVEAENYTAYNAPFPIVTALQALPLERCEEGNNSTQFEFSPVEYGSWDSAIAVFQDTKYMGSGTAKGQSCISGYDNLGFVLGTTSDIFSALCESLSQDFYNTANDIAEAIQKAFHQPEEPSLRALYATYPNVFSSQSNSTSALTRSVRQMEAFVDRNVVPRSADVQNKTNVTSGELYLVDGGFSNQNNPIWPFLHRQIDVLLVTDVSADTDENYPTGEALYQTYKEAHSKGLSRMPTVPSNDTLVAKGYNQRPTFFGCSDSADLMTIIYLPNYNYTYPSGISTLQLQFSKEQIDGMLSNGVAVATGNNTDADLATCIGCAIVQKTQTTLPQKCTQCFDRYCAKDE